MSITIEERFAHISAARKAKAVRGFVKLNRNRNGIDFYTMMEDVLDADAHLSIVGDVELTPDVLSALVDHFIRLGDPYPRITELHRPSPMDYMGTTYPEELEFDNSFCARCGTGIGGVLHADPETGHDRESWVGAFKVDGVEGVFCEDCAIEVHEGE